MTVPQHMVALAEANRIRFAAAALKREVAAGQLSIPIALDDERAQPIPICALLDAQRQWGSFRTTRLLNNLKIAELRRVRELTGRQRKAIANYFDPPPPTPAPVPVVPALPPPGMEPECVDARVLAALVRGSVTRTELGMRVREMHLAVDDLDASLERLTAKSAVVLRDVAGFELYDIGPRFLAVLGAA